MIHLLFALLSFTRLTQGTSINATNSEECPLADGTTRSVWGILGSCALTLLICVWHTVHFDVPQDDWHASFWWKGLCGLGSFFTPEIMIAVASEQWWEARNKVKRFHEKGYKWSMAHSFFAEMGGFVYCDEKGTLAKVDSLKFLELCEANKVINPVITVKEIRDKSRSDVLGKAILTLQLLWFMLQVVVRGSRGLAVTLVELDTVCMAILSLLVIFFWWDKPLRPESPYIFYYSPQGIELCPRTRSALSNAWKSEPSHLDWLIACFTCARKRRSTYDEEKTALVGADGKPAHSNSSRHVDEGDQLGVGEAACLLTWTILGALHLIAWDFNFPTETEKIMWRVASLVLAGGSLPFLSLFVMMNFFTKREWRWAENTSVAFLLLTGTLGVVSRALLVGLMLASLRALPCSAYQTVSSWTLYIPHL